MDRELELLLLQKKVILLKMRRRQERRQRRWWVRPVFVSHKEEGLYYTAVSNSMFARNVLERILHRTAGE